MKKQILFMTFLSLAFMFAGVNNAFGQPYVDTPNLDNLVEECPKPDPLDCETGGPLKPSPGVIYQYDITVSPAIIEDGGSIHWFATTDLVVLTGQNTVTENIQEPGGTFILTAGTTTITDPKVSNAHYNVQNNKGNILEIAWNYFDPSITVLLVAYVKDNEGCTDNIEVFKIEPSFNFIVDIFALEDNGKIQDPDNVLECVSPVQSATYNPAADGLLEMDYGDNYIYYLVTAANWVHSWMPTITPPTSSGGSTVGDVEWKYAADANNSEISWSSADVPVLATGYGTSVTSIGDEGECIVLRVNIEHSNLNEFLVAETYTMGIKGTMYDASVTDPEANHYNNPNLRDLNDDPDNAGECTNDVINTADYIITPRPTITAVAPSAPFVPKDPVTP